MSGSSSNQDKDHTLRDIVALSFLVLIVLFVVWAKARFVIIKPLFWLYWVEYNLSNYLHPIFGKIGLMAFTRATVQDYRYNYGIISNSINPQSVTMVDIGLVNHNIGRLCVVISALFGLVLIPLVLMFKGRPAPKRDFMIKGYKYKKTLKTKIFQVESAGKIKIILKILKFLSKIGIKINYTYKFEKISGGSKNLAEYQSRQWRAATTSAHLDPDLADPRWDPQMTEVEFCIAQGIININDDNTPEILSRALSKQIGKKINTIEKFPTHARAILALFWLNRTRKRSEGERLAGDFAEICLPHDTIETYKKVSEPKLRILAKRVLDEEAVIYFDDILSRFSGWRTAMVAMYGDTGPNDQWGGGKSGVLACSSFLWVKGIDRTLWYTLNNVGMRRYHTEGIGPIAQFQWERLHGPSAHVHVEGAIRGIIKEIKSNDISNLASYMKNVERNQS